MSHVVDVPPCVHSSPTTRGDGLGVGLGTTGETGGEGVVRGEGGLGEADERGDGIGVVAGLALLPWLAEREAEGMGLVKALAIVLGLELGS